MPDRRGRILEIPKGNNLTLEVIEIVHPARRKDFTVKKFIKMADSYYAEIQPGRTAYRIKISPSDYHRALRAYYSSKSIKCYPIEGTMEDNTFENAVYELEIK